MLSKMWVLFITNSITLESIGILVFSMKYGISKIFRYDLD